MAEGVETLTKSELIKLIEILGDKYGKVVDVIAVGNFIMIIAACRC